MKKFFILGFIFLSLLVSTASAEISLPEIEDVTFETSDRAKITFDKMPQEEVRLYYEITRESFSGSGGSGLVSERDVIYKAGFQSHFEHALGEGEYEVVFTVCKNIGIDTGTPPKNGKCSKPYTKKIYYYADNALFYRFDVSLENLRWEYIDYMEEYKVSYTINKNTERDFPKGAVVCIDFKNVPEKEKDCYSLNSTSSHQSYFFIPKKYKGMQITLSLQEPKRFLDPNSKNDSRSIFVGSLSSKIQEEKQSDTYPKFDVSLENLQWEYLKDAKKYKLHYTLKKNTKGEMPTGRRVGACFDTDIKGDYSGCIFFKDEQPHKNFYFLPSSYKGEKVTFTLLPPTGYIDPQLNNNIASILIGSSLESTSTEKSKKSNTSNQSEDAKNKEVKYISSGDLKKIKKSIQALRKEKKNRFVKMILQIKKVCANAYSDRHDIKVCTKKNLKKEMKNRVPILLRSRKECRNVNNAHGQEIEKCFLERYLESTKTLDLDISLSENKEVGNNSQNSLTATNMTLLSDINWLNCHDSDGGKDIYTKGKLKVRFMKNGEEKEKSLFDRNIKLNGNYGIAEMLCDDNIPKVEFVSCEVISEGKCKKISDKESDFSISLEVSKDNKIFEKKISLSSEEKENNQALLYYSVTVTNTGAKVGDTSLFIESGQSTVKNEKIYCPKESDCLGSLHFGSVEIKNIFPGESVTVTYEKTFSDSKLYEKIRLKGGKKDAVAIMLKNAETKRNNTKKENKEQMITRAEAIDTIIPVFYEDEKAIDYLTDAFVKPDTSVFSDVSPTHDFFQSIIIGAGLDFIESDSNGNFRPDEYITRLEALKILLRAGEIKILEGKKRYSDIPINTNDNNIVYTSEHYCVINLTDDEFSPNAYVSKHTFEIWLKGVKNVYIGRNICSVK